MTRAAVLLLLALASGSARAQEGMFLTEEQAPKAVFPDGDRVVRHDVESTPALRERITAGLDGSQPSLWEERYAVFDVARGGTSLGRALVVEEVGKFRPITFVVGVRPDGSVNDVAVMAYREPYGGEVRSSRFLKQYRDKSPGAPLRGGRDIVNVAGATLSVAAASRAVHKAQALAAALDRGGGMDISASAGASR